MSAMAPQQGPPQKRQRTGPGQNAPAAGADAETAKRGLISVNNLRYELPPDLSVVVSRSMHPHYFHTTSYTAGQRMVCQLNSGSNYIDGQNSYLTFDLETVARIDTAAGASGANPCRLTLGRGSAASLFKDISIIARSGDEIERTENLWSIMPEQDRMHRPADWFKSTGELMGYDLRNADSRLQSASVAETGAAYGDGNVVVPALQTTAGNDAQYKLDSNEVVDGTDTIVTTTRRYAIPLTSLSQFFRTTDKLVPAALASGLRFEFQLNSTNGAFNWENANNATAVATTTGHALTSWTVNNPRIVCDSYQLTDSIQRAMNETIASSGVEMPFVASHYSGYYGSGSDANIEIRKAVSRALTVVHKVIVEANQTLLTADAHETYSAAFGKGAGLLEYQARVGSLYFPHQKLKHATSASLLSRELYHHTLRGGSSAFKRPQNPGSLSFNEFRSYSNAVWTDLERSSAQNLTGIPINNSRVIELALKNDGASAFDNKQIQVFLFYVRLVRVFLNNVEVEE